MQGPGRCNLLPAPDQCSLINLSASRFIIDIYINKPSVITVMFNITRCAFLIYPVLRWASVLLELNFSSMSPSAVTKRKAVCRYIESFKIPSEAN